ncbi:Cys/Met metabolism PLP-dependent enzyme [Oesophagostomum dentatum]|uniref:Cys/Met metabolism PLP-dependent enzyme n=1 Tax=Oesophagostomum dentatum TaxID=61180 RepID=A0A0B1TT94_OESDE|nr:Cys/Met metabolism PLP-dependent enzyme [Oesophagostomum dentatum]
MSEFACPPPVNSGRERFGESFNQLQVESKISASHVKPLSHAHPVVTPIYHATTYRFDSVSQFNQTNHVSQFVFLTSGKIAMKFQGSNYIYQRCGNPTVDNVAVIIRELEQGAATMMYNSGLAACSAVLLEFLNAGDHLICMKPIYSGSYSFINETLPRFNVDVQFINVDKVKDFAAAVEAAIKKNTKECKQRGIHERYDARKKLIAFVPFH